jgi:ADP-heptose:LPS heptosyltransferase
VQVLLVRAGALGDLLLLRRTTAALAAAGHHVALLAPAAGTVLLERTAGIERLLKWDGPETARLLAGEDAAGPLAEALRTCDAAIAYTRSPEVVAALAARAQRLIVRDPSPPPGTHASHWLAEPLSALGVDARPEPADLRFTAEESDAARPILAQLPRAFLAVHPGSGSARKNWPEQRFAQLAARLTAGHRWLLALGPAEDVDPWRHLREAVVARELPLRVLGAALSKAGLYVGNDSGVTHLAAATGSRTLALFGPTDPRCWAPVGRRTSVLWRDPLADIAVDEVCAAARALGWGAPTSAASGPPSG